MDEIRFDNRVAVVTGAGGGLGKAYAIALANRGAAVVVNDLGGTPDGTGSDVSAAQLVVDEIKAAGGRAEPDYNSVSDWEGAQNIIKTALESFGRIDILITNAGILRDKSLIKMEIEDFEIVLAVHLMGTFFCTKAAFPHMRENGYGRIVNAISAAGVYGNFGQTNYAAAKLGIVGFMKCVQQEGAKYNILANAIAPIALTRLTTEVMPPHLSEKLSPEFVAPMVCWLASERCDVSGKIFMAGGGYFSRTAFIEGSGIFLNTNDGPITPEKIADNIDSIMTIEDGTEYKAAMDEAGHVFLQIS